MIKVTEIVLQFRDILLGAWKPIDIINALDSTGLFGESCVEALWELSIEIYMLAHYGPIVLYPYDDGSELCCDSGRITNIDAPYTHHVVCLPKEGRILFDVHEKKTISLTENDVLVFKKFVAYSMRYEHSQRLPLDFAHCELNSKSCFLKIDDLDFYIKEYHLDKEEKL